jgi:hypothetical protein
MNQFDFPSAAALAQIKNDALTASPCDKAASKVASIGSKIIGLAGFAGAATLTDLIQELKSLAANKDETNLIYFGETLVDDIARLYRSHSEMRQQLDEMLKSKELHEAVANATLHITRTNVEARLQRISHLIAAGVRARDLESESLDDMMRAAVELKDVDIVLLGKIYDSQAPLLKRGPDPHSWFNQVQSCWKQFVQPGWNPLVAPGALDPSKHLLYRSSFSRLESHGLIQKFRETQTATVGLEPYALLEEGMRFYERLREV